MKKWMSLFDLCPIRPSEQKERAARITAMSYLRNCQDKEQHMERQLLNTGMSAGQVSTACGFSDYTSFYRAFKAEYGIRPGAVGAE